MMKKVSKQNNLSLIKSHRTFEGYTKFYKHPSKYTQTEMAFSCYLPDKKTDRALLWLSGLTCTEENFIMKAGSQKYLCENNIAVFCPDTSPRGLNLPREHDVYDFGSGASFYLDAKTPFYKDYYQMQSYIINEFYELILAKFNISQVAISGHSVGGHGALIMGLKYPALFKSISAFAPIVNPMSSDWGKKALQNYLGDDENNWRQNDACELIKSGHLHPKPILIDQGLEDEFFSNHILMQNLELAVQNTKQKVQINYHPNFDHSYYFVASFIEKHIKFHSQYFNS